MIQRRQHPFLLAVALAVQPRRAEAMNIIGAARAQSRMAPLLHTKRQQRVHFHAVLNRIVASGFSAFQVPHQVGRDYRVQQQADHRIQAADFLRITIGMAVRE